MTARPAPSATPTHVYAAAGTYPVTLTVTDDSGATASASSSVTVVANTAPSAAFTTATSGLSVSTDAAASTDTDGTIASYAWEFGDGTIGSGATATHAYAAEGTYTVRLTVTDDQGATGTTTREVTVVRPPEPAADSGLRQQRGRSSTVALDASASTDPDGTIASYAWDFGDGTTGTGGTTSHTYAPPGGYDVTLTVTDDRGGSATVTERVTVAANQAPVARITSSVDRLVVALDGTTSTDADDTIVSYAWDFGDGTTGTGATTSHTYADDGTYTVRLTVTDGQGASDSVTSEVTVVDDPSVARDAFGRSVTAGWGTADRGGAWTLSGTLSRYSVAAGSGSVSLGAGASAKPMLSTVSIRDTDFRTVFTTDKAPTGGGQYVSLVGRAVPGGSEYRAKLLLASTGAVTAYVTRVDAGTEISLGSAVVSGLTYTAGTQAAGPLPGGGYLADDPAGQGVAAGPERAGGLAALAHRQHRGAAGRRERGVLPLPVRLGDQRPGGRSPSTTCGWARSSRDPAAVVTGGPSGPPVTTVRAAATAARRQRVRARWPSRRPPQWRGRVAASSRTRATTCSP